MRHIGDHVLAYAGPHEVGQAAEVVKLLLALETSEADDHTHHDSRVDGPHTVGELYLETKSFSFHDIT